MTTQVADVDVAVAEGVGVVEVVVDGEEGEAGGAGAEMLTLVVHGWCICSFLAQEVGWDGDPVILKPVQDILHCSTSAVLSVSGDKPA